MNREPKTLMEAAQYFADPVKCHEFVECVRWPKGVHCIHCNAGPIRISWIASRCLYRCKDCRKQFSVKKGTIFEDSALGLDKWLLAVWLIVNAKNGISSYEISRSLGVTQKSAWHMLQRIRLAMRTGTFETKLSGTVEVDETYVGGSMKNMHQSKKRKVRERGKYGKVAVMGMLERRGTVRAEIIPSAEQWPLMSRLSKNVEFGSHVYTDQHGGYQPVKWRYVHKVINHAHEYVRGQVHTNGMENFWSLLKRGLNGTYISVEAFHLFRYVDEQIFRYNNRKLTDPERFRLALKGIIGKRLTYATLTSEALGA